MIKSLFLTTLSVSFSASLMILMLLSVSPFIRRRYAAKWKYRLWILPAVRLLIPVSGTALWQPVMQQLSHFAGYAQPVQESSGRISAPAMPEPGITVTIPQQLTEPAALYSEKIQTGITFLDAAAALWLAGFVFFALLQLHSCLHLKKELLTKGIPIRDHSVLQQLYALSDSLHIKCRITVIHYSKADSPMLFGFIHPLLVLPEAQYDPQEFFFIARHELLHFKHRDIWVKLLLTAAACLHWFNPLIRLMQKQTAIDMELACDERVVQGMDSALRKAYSETLLSALQRSCTKRSILSAQFLGGKEIMKKRFENILIQKTGKNGTALLLGAAAVAFSLSFLAGCSFLESPSKAFTADTDAGNSSQTDASEGNTPETPADVSDDEESKNNDNVSAAQKDIAEGEILAYIKEFDEKKLSFDAAEWVTVPSERASELGIAQEHMDSGFYVHNEDTTLAELPVSADCSYSILNWQDSYERMTVSAEEFASVLKEREGTNIPYHLTIQDNEIVGIQEQYIP